MNPKLAIAYGMKRRNMKAKGGMINSGDALDEASKYEADKESDGQHMLPKMNEISSGAELNKAQRYQEDRETMGEAESESSPQSTHIMSPGALAHAKAYEWAKEKQGMQESGSGELPMSMMAHGGMAHPKNMAKMIMMKKYAQGGNVEMPLDMGTEHDDFLSDEADHNPPMSMMADGGMMEEEMDPKMKQKMMIHKIMGNLHSGHMK